MHMSDDDADKQLCRIKGAYAYYRPRIATHFQLRSIIRSPVNWARSAMSFTRHQPRRYVYDATCFLS